MSAHVLLNLLNELGKRDKMRDSRVIARSFDKSRKLMILQQKSPKQNVFFYFHLNI